MYLNGLQKLFLPVLRPVNWLFLFLLFIAVGCNKEDQIDGEFRVVHFTRNDIDLLPQWRDSCDLVFTFQFDEDDSHDSHHFRVEGNVFFQNAIVLFTTNSSEYFFTENNKYLQLGFDSPLINDDSTTFHVGIFPLKSDEASKTYEVLKFTSKKLWLRYSDNNDVFDIHLEEV